MAGMRMWFWLLKGSLEFDPQTLGILLWRLDSNSLVCCARPHLVMLMSSSWLLLLSGAQEWNLSLPIQSPYSIQPVELALWPALVTFLFCFCFGTITSGIQGLLLARSQESLLKWSAVIIRCRGLKLGQSHTRQASCPLYYCSGPYLNFLGASWFIIVDYPLAITWKECIYK